jgi:hypothetical protein
MMPPFDELFRVATLLDRRRRKRTRMRLLSE